MHVLYQTSVRGVCRRHNLLAHDLQDQDAGSSFEIYRPNMRCMFTRWALEHMQKKFALQSTLMANFLEAASSVEMKAGVSGFI